ncbi:hypothetical protein L1987_33251 [Smallanthus sonchifolius]|uniref:Uncharacterized protein n=1 Tax=Smallanthus sonchifolius TaxID=185202 RepID=A0ACB9HQI8_9ASTR|nr:hypothetical protein L1987_33251 [Smallanthus sonchifolius]
MQDLGEKSSWPRKFERNSGGKDKSKWCAFHEDFGHITEDCITLWKEISCLLSKGHLKEFLGKGKNKTKDHDRIPQRAKSPPPDAKVIGFISGGFDNCGTSHSAAKRNAKEAKTEQGDRPIRTSSLNEEKVISFNVDDMDDVQDPYHDGLVITLKAMDTRYEGGALNIPSVCQIANPMGSKTKEHDVKEVSLDAENPDVKILVGSNIPEDIEEDILNFLRGRKATFAWKHEDMTGATYQRLVNMMFKDKIGDTMDVYIDDMVVKSKKAEDHLRVLRDAFDIMDQYHMKLNPSKCHFEVGAGKFLGYMHSIDLYQDPQKKCKEFYDNLKKNKKFKWEEKHEQALQSLKEYLSSAPLLMKPEDGEPLSLYLAVSRSTVSAVLVKDHEGQQHSVYYVSKSLLPAETRYSHLEKLILALIMASTKLRHYFENLAIHVKTNYLIKCVLRKPEMSGWMAKWSVKLSAYDLIYEPRTTIKYQALADFVADFSSDIQQEADLEVQRLEESKDEWNLFTDGVSNVKGTGLGIILKSSQGDILPQSKSLKGEKLAKYLTMVKQLSIEFETFNIIQVPREDNTEADALANLASALRVPEGTKIPIIHILSPVIEKVNEVSNTEEETDIRDLEPIPGSWISPIKKNLQDASDEKNHNAFRMRMSHFIMFDNILYRKSIAGPYLRCLEDHEAREVLKDLHEGDCGCCDQKCDTCQWHNNILQQPTEPLYPIASPWPFMKWGTDIVGKLPKEPGGKVFMLAMTDYFSKWIEAEAFVQVREKEVISFMIMDLSSSAREQLTSMPVGESK